MLRPERAVELASEGQEEVDRAVDSAYNVVAALQAAMLPIDPTSQANAAEIGRARIAELRRASQTYLDSASSLQRIISQLGQQSSSEGSALPEAASAGADRDAPPPPASTTETVEQLEAKLARLQEESAAKSLLLKEMVDQLRCLLSDLTLLRACPLAPDQ
eukprot:jgi/Mesvir1/11254/Mv01059-RA.1